MSADHQPPLTMAVNETVFGVPWFKHDRARIIKNYAQVFRKVAENAADLL